MAPAKGESIERTDEHVEFMKKLGEYHERRGTHLDLEPKVGVRHIDLLNLYKRVTSEGGYDLCSDTKAKPLMWRRLAEEFIGKNPYTAAQAFQIKSVYYKNLCAYEISNHFDKEPPPKEILENMTARGGNVMGRTLENYQGASSREQDSLQNGDGDGSDASPEQKTPKDEKAEEDPTSATGRSTRGLRHQPPQRVLFQPDLVSGKSMRSQTNATTTGLNGSPAPAPTHNNTAYSSAYSHGASSTLASYEPSQSYPLSLKPVITPANNPDFYKNERKRKLEESAGPLARKYRNIMLPGTGFIGPNIYVRAQMALQSGIPEEEQYALHHLVKISHERGDKYRFDQFPGLADALVKKVLQVSSLYYDIDWDVSYEDEANPGDDETLNGLHGTSDVLQKLKARMPLITGDNLHDGEYLSQLNRIMEAGLVIRNMCMLDENARFLSHQSLIRDYLAIVLYLPQHNNVIELQLYALETAEQVLKYCDVGRQDAIYHSLFTQLEGKDRGAITLALRTMSRIGTNLAHPKRLTNIPKDILRKLQDWLLVEDEELRSACLDFLTQYTASADNVDILLQTVDIDALSRQLSRLLFFAAKEHREPRPAPRQERDERPASVPKVSRSVVESLLKLEEPPRSSEWLKMCFVSDPEAEMTQISLWQAYQATFASFHATHPHMIAGEFIKNVSNTFQGASAQVAGTNKYVIRGIKARKVPVDTGFTAGGGVKGRELHRCCWRIQIQEPGEPNPYTGARGPPVTREAECSEWLRDSDDMLKHILGAHLHFPMNSPTASAAPQSDKMDIDTKPSRPDSAASMAHEPTPPGTSNPLTLFDYSAADDALRPDTCGWSTCTRSIASLNPTSSTSSPDPPRSALLARHISTHLPSPHTETTATKHNLTPTSKIPPRATADSHYFTTLQDEKGDAAGVVLGAACVLRNVARFAPQAVGGALAKREEGAEGAERSAGRGKDGEERLFEGEVRERLFFAAAHQLTAREYVGGVLRAVKG